MRKLFCFLTALPFLGLAQEPHWLEGMNFRNIGPAGMSGRVTAIAARPENPEIIYTGTASGGLWLSENGGVSWVPLFDEQPVSSIGALALHNTHTDHVWVGTGEGNMRNSHTSGGGVFRSVDRGKTWAYVGLKETRNIHKLILHPTNPHMAYAAALGSAWGDSQDRGLYRTTDGGKTWTNVLANNASTGCADVVMDPNNPNKLIAALWDFRRNPWFFRSGGPGSGLFVSYDGGDTWKPIAEKEGLPKGELGRIGLAIAPSDPQWVYALVENKDKNALFRSEDGGATWNKVSDDGNIGNRPFYYSDLFVNPQDKRTIYSAWTLLSRSMDGGKTWDVIGPYHKIHPDHHTFFVHPSMPNYLIEGNDGGLNISKDGGTTWRFVENLPLAQFYHIRTDNEVPYNVYGGLQDNGSWVGPAYVWKVGGIRNSYWQEVCFGDGFDVVPDPTDNRYVYAMAQEGYVQRVDKQTARATFIKPIHPEGLPLRFNWNAAIAPDPLRQDVLYFGSQFVHRTKDHGQTWEIISPDLTTNNPEKQKQLESGGLTYDVTGAENHTTLLAIAPSMHEAGVIYTGSDDGKLYVTRNDGAQWKDLSNLLKEVPAGAWIPQIQVSPHKKDEALVVVNDYRRNNWKPYVYRMTGYGSKAERIVDEKQVDGHCLSIVQDPVAQNLYFLGTETGLYYSLDGAKSWNKWPGKSFPTVPVRDMEIHPTGDLVVGTFGRAVWILDDLTPLRKMASNSQLRTKKLLAFEPQLAYQASYSQPSGMRFGADATFAGSNRPDGVRLSYYTALPKDSLKPDQLKLTIKDSQGQTIRNRTYTPKPGINVISWGMEQKGVGSLSENPNGNKKERGGWQVPPGTYRLVLELGGNKDSTLAQIAPDPRMPFDQAAYGAYLELCTARDSLVTTLNRSTAQLANVKSSMELLQKRLELADTAVAKPLQKEMNQLKDTLKVVLNLYFPKPDQKGYYSEPFTLEARLGQLDGYLYSNQSRPNQPTELLFNQVKAESKNVVEKTNAFIQNHWLPFEKKVAEAQLPLTYPVTPTPWNE